MGVSSWFGFELQHDCIDVTSKADSFDDAISHIHLFQNPVSGISSELTIKSRDNMQCDGNFGFTRQDYTRHFSELRFYISLLLYIVQLYKQFSNRYPVSKKSNP